MACWATAAACFALLIGRPARQNKSAVAAPFLPASSPGVTIIGHGGVPSSSREAFPWTSQRRAREKNRASAAPRGLEPGRGRAKPGASRNTARGRSRGSPISRCYAYVLTSAPTPADMSATREAAEELNGGLFLDGRAEEAEPYSGDVAAPPFRTVGRRPFKTAEHRCRREGRGIGGESQALPRFGASGGDQAVVH